MSMLPLEIARIIKGAASQDGRISLCADSWQPLAEAGQQTPPVAGLYAIGIFLGVQYDRATSRIIYLGSTRNLRTRLLGHNASSHNCYIELLKQRYSGGLIAVRVPLPELPVEWLRAVEDSALQSFNGRFGRYPVCNMDSVESSLVSAVSDVIQFAPCEGLPFPLSLETLSTQLGSKSLGRLRERLPPEEYDPALIEARRAESDERNRIDGLSMIRDEHVAAWSAEKMRAVIGLCRQLTVVKKRHKSKVTTFDVAARNVPRPITWGEVALIQGRILAGCWFPREKVWVKIVYNGELLGQATLDEWLYCGEDKSDRPQTRRRTSIWSNKRWLREYEAIEGDPAATLPSRPRRPIDASFLPEDVIVGIENSEHLRLMLASQRYDRQEAEREAIVDKSLAKEHDKRKKGQLLLQQRIEATFQDANH